MTSEAKDDLGGGGGSANSANFTNGNAQPLALAQPQVVLQVQQAIEQPENFLKLLVTKSVAFQRFRATCAGSTVLLAVVDSLVSQLSVSWVRQKAGEISNHVETVSKLICAVARMLRRKKSIEARIRLVNRMDTCSHGELIVAWYLLANRDHGEAARKSERLEQRQIKYEAPRSSDSEDVRPSMLEFFRPHLEFKTPVVRLDDNRGWIGRWCGSESPVTPSVLDFERYGIRFNARVIPTSDAHDSNSYFLQDPTTKVVRTRALNHHLSYCLESEMFPKNLMLEFSTSCTVKDRSQVQSAIELIEKDVRSLAQDILSHRSNDPTKKNLVVVVDKGRTRNRRLPPLLDALVPKEWKRLEEEIREFMSESGVEKSENFTALLVGVPGSGKSSNILHLASKLDLVVELYSLASFAQISCSYNTRALILIEEFETQFMDMVNAAGASTETANNLSRIYNLLDGSSGLQGCVVILTANSISDEIQRNYPAMFRTGRIDRIVRFSNSVPREDLLSAFRVAIDPISKELADEAVANIDQVLSFTPSDFKSFLRLLARSWKISDKTDPKAVFLSAFEVHRSEQTLRTTPQLLPGQP